MSPETDYYAILGILPSAETAVVRAAYRALAQLYHPDRNVGKAEEFSSRMAELNEAYSVLSDGAKRAEYDRLRSAISDSSHDSSWAAESGFSESEDPLAKDWGTAVKYFPDLANVDSRLKRISWKLAYTYRAFVLAEKAFRKRAEIAAAMEREFLRTYFGSNPQMVAFATELIASGKKEAARALNQAVRVLGDSLDPAVVINRVRSDYGINESTEDLSLMSEYDITFVAGRYHYDRFTYEKLEDAVRYAKQQRKKI